MKKALTALTVVVCTVTRIFAETVEEVQKAMAESSRPARLTRQVRLLSTADDGLVGSRTYEGYGELNVIKGNGTLQVSFDVDDYFTSIDTATIYLSAYDVDTSDNECDMAYFNGVEVGGLWGHDGSWVHNSFDVSPSTVKTNSVNNLIIAVDVYNGGWVTSVDHVTLELSGKRGNKISNVKSSYCSGSYGNGRKGTFLTGIGCKIEFEIMYGSIVHPIDYLLVNGERLSENGLRFTYDVGNLKPGDKLEVVAVDINGDKSDSFRVNIDIADYPPFWNRMTRILAEPQPERQCVLYTSSEVNPLFLFDMVEDRLDMLGVDFDMELKPSINLHEAFESDTAQFHAGSDIGGVKSKDGADIGRFSDMELSVSLSGGNVYQWMPLSQTWEPSSIDLGVKISGQAETPKFRPSAFPPAYAKAGLSASVECLARTQGGEWLCEVAGDPLIAIRGTVGVGIEGLKAEGYLQGGVILHAVSPGTPNHIQQLGTQIKAEILAAILTHTHRLWSWDKTFWNIGGTRARLLSAAEKTAGGLDYGDWIPISRDYARSSNNGIRATKHLLASTGGLPSLGDGYPYPSPALAANGTGDVLLYLRDNAARSDINRTELVCRMGTSNEWSSAETVWDDGTADFMPSVAVGADGTVFAAWANANGLLPDDAAIEEVCRSMEIAVGVRNAATGEWSCRSLTDDASLDMIPKVKVATDGSAVVAWVRNDSGEFIGTAERPSSIMLATYRNGLWVSPVPVAPDVGMIYSFDVAYNGSTVFVVYAKDGDGDFETAEDREVWGVSVANGVINPAVRLSADGADAARPFAWYDSEGVLCTLWLEGNDLVTGTQLGARRSIATNCDIPPDFSLLPRADGGAMLVWNGLADSETGVEIVCATYDSTSGNIGDPSVLIHSETKRERGITGAVGVDGALRMAYESVTVETNAEGIAEFGAVELKTFRRERGMDVGFADSAFSFEGDVVAGETTNLLVKVTNFGTEIANGATVRVWFGEAQRTLLGTVVTNIPPLSSTTVSVPWLAVQRSEDVIFSAKVESGAFEDSNEANNTAAWRPLLSGMASLHNVRCIKNGESSRYIGVTVRNNGIAPLAEGTEVRFWRGGLEGELLSTTNLSAVLPGIDNEQEVGFAWDFAMLPMTSGVERVVAELVYGDSHPMVSVDVEAMLCKITFAYANGEPLDIEPLYIPYGCAIGELPPLEAPFTWVCNGNVVTSDSRVIGNMMLVAGGVLSYTVGDGEVVINGCDTSLSGVIAIPSSIMGCPVTGIGVRAFRGCRSLTSVTIPDSVTSIGKQAFYSCNDLASVTIPDSVTSIGIDAFSSCNASLYDTTTIPGLKLVDGWVVGYTDGIPAIPNLTGIRGVGGKAFYSCSGLTSVTIPDTVTSIGDYAFYNCSGLTDVTIRDGATSIGEYVFAGCNGLTNVAIPDSVMNIGDYAFENCWSLTSVTIGNGVMNIGNSAFYGCSGLTSVTIPDSVTSIGNRAFYGCSGLTCITIGDGVMSIGDSAFYGCNGLTSVNITDLAAWCNISFNFYAANPLYYAHRLFLDNELLNDLSIPNGVTNITYAFYNCSTLKSVTIPDGVTSIGDYAFSGCSGLMSVTIPNSVTNIGRFAFSGCRSLTNVVIPNSVTRIGYGAFSSCSGLTSVAIPDNVTSIGDYAFSGCSGLMSVTIPNSVTNIGRDAFSGCSRLASVTIPDSVTSIGEYVFENCSGLMSVTIPDSVTSIGRYAFYKCSGLTSVTIGDGVTSIGDYAFYNCSGLTSVTMPDSVTSIGGSAFSGCSGLTSITIGDGVMSIGHEAFYNCGRLTSVTIPDSVTSIGYRAFYGCNASLYDTTTIPGLKLVDGWVVGYTDGIPDALDLTGIRGIGYGAFSSCSGLTSVIMGDSVVSIGSLAFSGCNGLTSVTIGNGVINIGNSAFSGCSGLTSIVIPNSVTNIGEGAFSGCSALMEIALPFVGARRGNSGTPDSLFGFIFGTSSYTGGWITKQEYSSSLSSYYSYYIPSELKKVVITDETALGYGAFFGCSRLTSVTIPDSVTSIGEKAFYSCSGLTSVTIPDNVTSIGGSAFYCCSGLTSIVIPNSVTSIGSSAFSGCSGLTSVTIPDSVTSIGESVFSSCRGLTSVTMPDSVTSIGTCAFYLCSGLTSIVIPNSITNIGNSAFSGCSGLTSVALPDGVMSIEGRTFSGCSGLTSVTIPNSVTSIGTEAFSGCNNLMSVTIPYGVTSIGGWAFCDCWGLTSMTMVGDCPDIGFSAFAYINVSCVARLPRGNATYAVSGGKWQGMTVEWYDPVTTPMIEGDEGAMVTGDAVSGYTIAPSVGKANVIVTIPACVDAAKVTVVVSPEVASVKANGAAIKVVKDGHDITAYLDIPLADGNGTVVLSDAIVKDTFVREAMDTTKGAVIEISPDSPTLTTPATRPGLTYMLREGNTLDGMSDGDSKVGDGEPWTPTITVRGGNSGFYTIKVTK